MRLATVDIVLVALGEGDEEIVELIDSIGYRIVKDFRQKRSKRDPRFFIGKGKAEEVKDFVEENDVDMVVFDADLNASQHYQLENRIGIRCVDRIGLILDLFATRARTKESRYQVDLARIEYELPLLREWISKKKVDERPGFMAGGEYRVDTYYEHARKRKKRIHEELRKMERERELRRRSRRDGGYGLISIVGYANAGKSSLFNVLSSEDVLVEDRMFSTLSTTTRRFHGTKRKILLTDTVGLIKDLPVWLVESFRSTLEEVFLSDIVLLLLDGSDPLPEFDRKLTVALETLMPRAQHSSIVPIVNKIDLMSEEEMKLRRVAVEERGLPNDVSFLSVIEGTGLEEFVGRLHAFFLPPTTIEILLPMNDGISSAISWLYDNCSVQKVDYGAQAHVILRCNEELVKKIEERVRNLGGMLEIVT